MASVATVASVNSEDFVMKMVCEACKSFRVSKKSQESYFQSISILLSQKSLKIDVPFYGRGN